MSELSDKVSQEGFYQSAESPSDRHTSNPPASSLSPLEDSSLWADNIEPEVKQLFRTLLRAIKRANSMNANVETLDAYLHLAYSKWIVHRCGVGGPHTSTLKSDGTYIERDLKPLRGKSTSKDALNMHLATQAADLASHCRRCGGYPATFLMRLLDEDSTFEPQLGLHCRRHRSSAYSGDKAELRKIAHAKKKGRRKGSRLSVVERIEERIQYMIA